MAKKTETSSMKFTLAGVGLLFAVVGGSLAGVITSVATNQSLERYAESLAERETLLAISQEKPRPLPGTYEEALGRVQGAGWPATAILRERSQDGVNAANWVTEASALAVGVVITSDGWMLFDADSVEPFEATPSAVEVWVQGDRYEISEIVFDTLTNYALVKVDAALLSTLAFGSSQAMRGGDLLFVLTNVSQIVPSSLKTSQAIGESPVAAAETYMNVWELVDAVESPAPILNAAGELVAFATAEGGAVPFHHIRPFIQSVLRYGEVRYAAAGFYAVSVGDVLNIDPAISARSTFGAYVVAPNARTAAVMPNGPASEAGLRAGDLIVAVDNVRITDEVRIADLMKAYEPGQDADFTVLRGEEEVEIVITFASLEDISY